MVFVVRTWLFGASHKHKDLPVYNIVLVKVLQSQQDLAAVKLCAMFTKSLVFLDVHHQITSSDVLHHEIQSGIGLKA